MEIMLECKNITKRYGQILALNNFNLSLQKGRIVGLLGTNGSGKTTLIKMVAGLLQPDAGFINVCGKTPGTETKALVSYLPEQTYLPMWMKVKDIINYFDDFYSDFDKERAFEMLKALGVRTDMALKTLSKGTKEKVQLVLVMSRRAKLYLLDEPIGGVDPATRDYILNTIISNYSSESSILISTHLIADVEKVLDDFLFVNQGQIFMAGSADDVRTNQGKSIDQLFREVFRC